MSGELYTVLQVTRTDAVCIASESSLALLCLDLLTRKRSDLAEKVANSKQETHNVWASLDDDRDERFPNVGYYLAILTESDDL